MSDRATLLAEQIEACCEDAKRPVMVTGALNFVRYPDAAVVPLANGLLAISAALRSRAEVTP